MEDRHYLSEPRPISGLKLPTWEVDVMREGVDMPILTLQVDSQILPPRRRKKKVVWKLPEDLSKNPKFGMEDKRRILELFKQKKKELKRQRKSQTQEQQSRYSPREDNQNRDSSSKQQKVTSEVMPSSALNVDSYLSAKEEKPQSYLSAEEEPQDPGEEKVELREDIGEEKVEEKSDIPLSGSLPPPGLHMSGLSIQESPTRLQRAPNSNPTSQQQPLPLPMPRMPERAHSFSNAAPLPPPGLNGGGRRASTSSLPPGISFGRRQFVVADPQSLGHVLMETYYTLVRRDMVAELSEYYLPHSQKSLTVGGAHALCQHVDQRHQQLESLRSMVLQVKGVLQHPHFGDDSNIFVVITGTCVQPHTLPFCHSVVLAKVGPQAYQIQNDAMAFLTTEG